MKIRLSIGSAVHLGLRRAKMYAPPTTLYAMIGEHCVGTCQFCTQSRSSETDRKLLSRVIWPVFDLEITLDKIKTTGGIGRICLQTLRYPDLVEDLYTIVTRLHTISQLPISICINPIPRSQLEALKEAGVERVGVGLDCATPELFKTIKPGFHWDRYLRFIEDVVETFGTGSVHLIAGLGETDRALLHRFQDLKAMGCHIGLFAFTPVRGTALTLQSPDIGRYRALQVARYLIMQDQTFLDNMSFRNERLVAMNIAPEILAAALNSGTPFRTSGCPGCNRPMYNERPGGEIYNYPRLLTIEEKRIAKEQWQTYMKVWEHSVE
ncbi:MAG: radical SAM protein [Anaerolineae bacterium]|nr:radical SAM protein [Anaerolineae bacterium]